MRLPSLLAPARFALVLAALAPLLSTAALAASPAPRQMEALDRGVIALKAEEKKIIVSWRLLGTEPADLAFNLYRTSGGAAPEKLNAAHLTGATFFTDTTFAPAKANAYTGRPVLAGCEQPASPPASTSRIAAHAPVRPYLSIPLRRPERYTAHDTSVGDLDGDGTATFTAIGHDVTGEVMQLSATAREQFPNSVFFAGQLQFPARPVSPASSTTTPPPICKTVSLPQASPSSSSPSALRTTARIP